MKQSIFITHQLRIASLFLAAILLPKLGFAQSSDTNIVVNIVSPTNGAFFRFIGFPEVPNDIEITAKAEDSNAVITNVAFFADGELLGNATNFIILDPPGVNGVTGPVYVKLWSLPPTGTHVLTATATDAQGASATSPPVTIVVNSPSLPPVRITSPANNAVFRSPLNLPIVASARDPYFTPFLGLSNLVTNVEFFAGTEDLGAGHRLTQLRPFIALSLSNQFELVWTNPAAGSYPLTAVATDRAGVSSTSPAVNITILPPTPPATNLPDIVSIVATDPIAVAGTNAWFWYGPTHSIPTWTNWPPTNGQSFTNWGPKDALFTVNRHGSPAADLVVDYSISGTASNGTDYATLPGTVTISAGASSAFIMIVPVDNGVAPAKTVVLTLTPSTNVPPGYLVGFPSRAEALILENWLRPLPYLVSDGSFNYNGPGPDGAWYRADWSSDLLNWIPLCTNQVFQGSINFLDADALANPLRYYRIVPLDGPP